MTRLVGVFRTYAARLIAVVIILAIYGFARLPSLSKPERERMASRFSFARLPLPGLEGNALHYVRAVHPDLERISSWISSVGAAVALKDLDGDGLSNDAGYIDPRTDQVIVAPAPGTPARYKPFELNLSPLPFDRSTMAPMGCLPGDFNKVRCDRVIQPQTSMARRPLARL